MGKSVIAAALCRLFVRRGLRVAPFKAQNMSNNSGVTPEGLEMGRAQIVQAEAARHAPHVDMNPILLKPTSEIGSQVILLGRVDGNSSARDYHARKERVLPRGRRRPAPPAPGPTTSSSWKAPGPAPRSTSWPSDIVNLRMAE
ncbi:MAG: hypothetical protein MZV70_29920 [Desulfobacterales bacterium]|nr:hypothetical protein [Desulfobacterales bacterium]